MGRRDRFGGIMAVQDLEDHVSGGYLTVGGVPSIEGFFGIAKFPVDRTKVGQADDCTLVSVRLRAFLVSEKGTVSMLFPQVANPESRY
jgi:hypothetical protein